MQQTTSTLVNLAHTSNFKYVYSTPCLKVYGSVGELTLGGGGTRCDGGNSSSNNLGSTAKNAQGNCTGSDPSLKENIACVGMHPLGFGIYLFDYKAEFRSTWGYGRQFGVMADEVKLVVPEAVLTYIDGYMMVDYALLGISRAVH